MKNFVTACAILALAANAKFGLDFDKDHPIDQRRGKPNAEHARKRFERIHDKEFGGRRRHLQRADDVESRTDDTTVDTRDTRDDSGSFMDTIEDMWGDLVGVDIVEDP